MATRWMVPAGTPAVVCETNGPCRGEELAAPLEFDSLPRGWSRWVIAVQTSDVTIRVPRAMVRPVARERARIDTHGWRDRNSD